jgi:hypothetical protein
LTTNNSSGKGRSEQDDDKKHITRYHDKKVSNKPPSFLNKTFLSIIGPGLITGASDDDPSGIATYSQAGAQFGFGML